MQNASTPRLPPSPSLASVHTRQDHNVSAKITVVAPRLVGAPFLDSDSELETEKATQRFAKPAWCRRDSKREPISLHQRLTTLSPLPDWWRRVLHATGPTIHARCLIALGRSCTRERRYYHRHHPHRPEPANCPPRTLLLRIPPPLPPSWACRPSRQRVVHVA